MENCYTVRMKSSEELTQLSEGTGHFFETLSVGSVSGTYHSKIYAFLIKIRFQTEKCINMPIPA